MQGRLHSVGPSSPHVCAPVHAASSSFRQSGCPARRQFLRCRLAPRLPRLGSFFFFLFLKKKGAPAAAAESPKLSLLLSTHPCAPLTSLPTFLLTTSPCPAPLTSVRWPDSNMLQIRPKVCTPAKVAGRSWSRRHYCLAVDSEPQVPPCVHHCMMRPKSEVVLYRALSGQKEN